mmetsp:Transcript_342/g.436  ORF Transcript_342/g.436 Transcript_342/m.436 type:complete len:129 (+) Transcript_342:242-628(+)
MGTGRTKSKPRSHAKKKGYKRGHATRNRARDIDQIQDDLKTNEGGLKFNYDDDLPGGGQFYCTPCAQHFITDDVLKKHIKSKRHKRRLKDVVQEQYSQEEAERAAGMTKEVLPPAHKKYSASTTMETA